MKRDRTIEVAWNQIGSSFRVAGQGILNRGEGILGEMVEDPNSKNVYIQKTAKRGRGVFARKKIGRGELIERSPVIVIPGRQWSSMTETVLSNYVFDWGEKEEHAAVALGYVSIYNHSYTPN